MKKLIVTKTGLRVLGEIDESLVGEYVSKNVPLGVEVIIGNDLNDILNQIEINLRQQGSWAIELNNPDWRAVRFKNPNVHFKNLNEWINACKNHDCENKQFLPADDPKGRCAGVICDCDAFFEVKLTREILNDSEGFKNGQHKIIKLALESAEGRVALSQYLSLKPTEEKEFDL